MIAQKLYTILQAGQFAGTPTKPVVVDLWQTKYTQKTRLKSALFFDIIY